MDKGAVSADENDPRLRDLMDLELSDDRLDVLDGVGGRGFSSSFPNSLNNLSRPGSIWRAIMGKWFRRSVKDLTSFFRGMDALALPDAFPTAGLDAATSFPTCIVAGMIGVGSHVPTRGFDMK
jgi:hypothetical protein